jgi:hypothetical protein
MPVISTLLIEALCSSDGRTRAGAASQIYQVGVAPALRICQKWRENAELAELLATPQLHIIVGVAVIPETFARIRASAGDPALAAVPPDQDAQEFELHAPGGVSLDILTSKDLEGQGAIARYLKKFGEGIQQVEFRCKNVDRASDILKRDFALNPIYPASRVGANNTRINFFLVAAETEKLLIELYEN